MIDIATAAKQANNTIEMTAVKPKPKKDKLGRAYATGRRKNASARVWIKAGSGKVTINGKEFDGYFPQANLQMIVLQPFGATNTNGQFDVICTVKGGGVTGQAGAIRHGISRALQFFDPELRQVLKAVPCAVGSLLTRDPRVVERKKAGRKKARKRFQFSKR